MPRGASSAATSAAPTPPRPVATATLAPTPAVPATARPVLRVAVDAANGTPLTRVMEGKTVKVIAWYDNEWGYSVRCVDLVLYMATKGI